MDGFGTNSGIIVIAATNRPDVLDPALLRPGRFDRQITVNRPDAQGREDILKVHSRNKPLGPDVDLKEIAKDTIGFTGADLENLLNEAALLAVRRKKKALTMQEISDATSRVEMGTEKNRISIPKKPRNLLHITKQVTLFHHIILRATTRLRKFQLFHVEWVPAATLGILLRRKIIIQRQICLMI